MKKFNYFLDILLINLTLIFKLKFSLIKDFNKITFLIRKSKFEEALVLINKNLKKNIKDSELLSLKWVCLKKIWKIKEALDIFTYTYRINPKDKSILWEIWEVTLLLWNPVWAVNYLEKCQKTKFKTPYYSYILALAYIQTFQFDKCLEIIKELEKIMPWDESLENLKKILKDKKKTK